MILPVRGTTTAASDFGVMLGMHDIGTYSRMPNRRPTHPDLIWVAGEVTEVCSHLFDSVLFVPQEYLSEW